MTAVCECGHLQSDHAPRADRTDEEQVIGVEGHGPCVLCDCPRFRWVSEDPLDERVPAFISGLRAAADWFEQHPEHVPVWNNCPFDLFADTPEELVVMRRALGHMEKHADSNFFSLRHHFSENVYLNAHINREQVCQKVVKEVVHVPATIVPAHDKEIVEWVCVDSLLDAVAS